MVNGDGPEPKSGQPAVAQIRPAEMIDLPAVAQVHVASFPGFFLTMLGPAVLHAYYRRVLDYEQGILLVAESGGRLVGFAAGFVDPAAFYRQMAARRWRFAGLVLTRLVTRPRLLRRLIVNRRRLARPAPHAESPAEDSCELSSIAVAPGFAGKGLGKELVSAFIAAARRRKAANIYLTTDAENNDAVNGLYQRLSFRLARTFAAAGGRAMNEYVLPIPADDNAEPHGPRA